MEAENDSSSDTESTHFQDIDSKECMLVQFVVGTPFSYIFGAFLPPRMEKLRAPCLH